MKWITVVASIATALTFFVFVWQLRLSQKALGAQTRAIVLQTYLPLALEFLNTLSLFDEHMNNPETKESDLSPAEKRALDRYFHFANMQYVLTQENAVDKPIANQWLREIRWSVTSRAIVERWRSAASKFALDEGFKAFYEQTIKDGRMDKTALEARDSV